LQHCHPIDEPVEWILRRHIDESLTARRWRAELSQASDQKRSQLLSPYRVRWTIQRRISRAAQRYLKNCQPIDEFVEDVSGGTSLNR